MELMGLNEIATAAGVSAQAVSNWRKRSDLPTPLAELASGPIWDGRVVRAWLKTTGRLLDQSTRDIKMNKLVKDRVYTHADVVAAIGGEPQSYLPQSGGRIVGGRFKQDDMNPQAPEIVIVGNLPRVARKAEMIAAQDSPIPVFMKEATNRWRFHGYMRCTAYETSRRAVQATIGADQRKEYVAGILRFEHAR